MPLLHHLGRAMAVHPPELGHQFQSLCEIQTRERQPPSPENGWSAQYEIQTERLYWEDEDRTGRRWFCTFSGYWTPIYRQLQQQLGQDLTVRYLRDDQLGEPDMEFLRHVQWRTHQPEVVSAILANRSGQILCDVGFGKSFIIGRLARAFPKSKIVAVAPSRSIVREIYQDLRLDLSDVGLCGDGGPGPDRVTVAVSNSLKYCPTDASLVLVDEAHRLLSENYVRQLWRFERARLFGFTATPEGLSSGRDGFLTALYGPVLADVTYQQNVSAGNVVPLEVHVYACPDGPDTSGIEDPVRRKRLGYWRNHQRNQLIAQAVRHQLQELGPECQILVMTDTTEHALALQRLLPDFQAVHNSVGGAKRESFEKLGIVDPDQTLCRSSDVPKLKEQFSNRQLLRAISTGVWSTGVNFPDLEVLVRAEGGGSEIASGQIPGRLSRLANQTGKDRGRVVDFSDSFCPAMQRKWQQRQRVYKKKDWKIRRRQL